MNHPADQPSARQIRMQTGRYDRAPLCDPIGPSRQIEPDRPLAAT